MVRPQRSDRTNFRLLPTHTPPSSKDPCCQILSTNGERLGSSPNMAQSRGNQLCAEGFQTEPNTSDFREKRFEVFDEPTYLGR